MRRFAVSRAASVARDLRRIQDHLVAAYQGFGDTDPMARERAAARIREAAEYMMSFSTHPHRGTVHPHLRDGIRHVANQRFVFYFEIDGASQRVTILAVFFGGEDHLGQTADRFRR